MKNGHGQERGSPCIAKGKKACSGRRMHEKIGPLSLKDYRTHNTNRGGSRFTHVTVITTFETVIEGSRLV